MDITKVSDNQTQCANLVLSDKKRHGIIDGGHTFRQIIESKEWPKNDVPKFVQIEVITNVSHIEYLADARNMSVAVDPKSMEELRGSFESLKNVINNITIGDNRFIERVAFKQNEFWEEENVNAIDAHEIVAIVNMFNPNLYNPLTNSHPIQSYTGKEVSLSKFIKLDGRTNQEGDKAFRDKVVNEMAPIIPDIFRLWDTIECGFPDAAKDLKRKYGTKPYSNYGNPKVKKVALFSNKTLEYSVPRGIMYPVVGAFRSLVERDETTGLLRWSHNPFDAWQKAKAFIVETIIDNSETYSHSPEHIGKSKIIWDNLYMFVRHNAK